MNIPVYRTPPTPYTRYGDWFPKFLIALVFIVLILNILPKKKRPSVLDDLLLSRPRI